MPGATPASASKRGRQPQAPAREQAQDDDDDLINYKSELLSRKPAPSPMAAAASAVVAEPGLEPSTSQSSGDAAAALSPPPSANKRRRQDATPNKSLAFDEPLFSHMFESLRNHPHAPEHIVWGSNSCFKAVKHFPALVLTEGTLELLSVECKAAIEGERERHLAKHPWVMQEPVKGGNVVVVFIYGPRGPSWNPADLQGSEWMPFDDVAAQSMLESRQVARL